MSAARLAPSSSPARAASSDDEGPLLGLVYLLYLTAAALARALPERPAYALAHTAGALWSRIARRKRAVVARNLSRVTGLPLGVRALDRLVVDAYRSYARYWLETFRLATAPRSLFLERFTCHGVERLDALLAEGRGVVVVVGHLGNWDAAGAWAGASGRPAATVAEVLRPRRLFEYFSAQRARLGITILPAAAGVTAELVVAARAGKLVALLGDRDLRGRGAQVDFFGARTTMPVGPAAVALRSGAPLLVAGIYSVELPGGRRGWEAEIGEPIELPATRTPGALAAVVQEVARQLEGFVARRPEEWHVFQPFWLEDRRPA